MRQFNILIITPLKHIETAWVNINKIGNCTYLPDPSLKDLDNINNDYQVIFTNPNKSKIFLGRKIFNKFKNLKIICTASTGTVHIDLKLALKKNIKIISLKNEYKTLKQISSTAELAFALMINKLRYTHDASISVRNGVWDYEKFIGRQINSLKIGIVGYGRLGKMFAQFCLSFGANVYIYDPYKNPRSKKIRKLTNLKKLFMICDVVSLHSHVTENTINFIDKHILSTAKKNLLLVNTARGEIVNESDLVKFLKFNPHAFYATDVLSNETKNKNQNVVLKFAKTRQGIHQTTITPHIGGMTSEAQKIAYNQAVFLLSKEIKNRGK